eukprot:TRINITY_DN7379_c0_g2_i1.p2 TRINITY_DN7379_c0_g2~~TRINITY_DN7379_c0_g2_i1.p2  ORF type:complete len:119 (+),score=28.00 TRINITY_DN7379_c0_g2_i1:123-479(+)
MNLKGVHNDVDELEVSQGGVKGDKNFGSSGREVLITDQELNEKHSLAPGSQKENIIVENMNSHGHAKGSIFTIGSATFVLGDKLSCPNEKESLKGERGIFASVTSSGKIKKGDGISWN